MAWRYVSKGLNTRITDLIMTDVTRLMYRKHVYFVLLHGIIRSLQSSVQLIPYINGTAYSLTYTSMTLYYMWSLPDCHYMTRNNYHAVISEGEQTLPPILPIEYTIQTIKLCRHERLVSSLYIALVDTMLVPTPSVCEPSQLSFTWLSIIVWFAWLCFPFVFVSSVEWARQLLSGLQSVCWSSTFLLNFSVWTHQQWSGWWTSSCLWYMHDHVALRWYIGCFKLSVLCSPSQLGTLLPR